MATITVETLLAEEKRELKLELRSGEKGLGNNIDVSEINRPAFALSGYFGYFHFRRIQVMGKTEFSYMSRMPVALRVKRLKQIFSYKIPCLVVTSRIKPLKEMIALSEQNSIPIFTTSFDTQEFMHKLIYYLESRFAPSKMFHGSLVEVYGVGVLIIGESGVGKSETALELIQRGHRLIADDVVKLSRESGSNLNGSANVILSQNVEIRGLGIIDVKDLFGTRAIRDKKRIEIIVELEEWKKGKTYERLGLSEKIKKILGVSVPKLVIPVRPGRNLAIIIEVAAMNYRLKKMGVNSARDLSKKIKNNLKNNNI